MVLITARLRQPCVLPSTQCSSCLGRTRYHSWKPYRDCKRERRQPSVYKWTMRCMLPSPNCCSLSCLFASLLCFVCAFFIYIFLEGWGVWMGGWGGGNRGKTRRLKKKTAHWCIHVLGVCFLVWEMLSPREYTRVCVLPSVCSTELQPGCPEHLPREAHYARLPTARGLFFHDSSSTSVQHQHTIPR